MNKVRKVITGLLVSAMVAGVMLIAAVGCAPRPEEKVFKFANINAFSGPYAPWGWMSQPAFEIAAEDLNADGGIEVGGDYYPVEIVTYDNTLDPTVSVTLTRMAIYDDGIKFMSVISADDAIAVAELCNSEKVVLFGMFSHGTKMGPEYPFSFNHYYEVIEGGEVVMNYIGQTYPDYTRIAEMQPDDVRGHLAGEDFEQVAPTLGFTVVDVVYSEAGITDFYSVLSALMDKGVDIISLGCSGGADQAHIIKQARELGFEGLFIHPDTIDVPTVAEIAGIDAIEGNLAASQLVEMPTDVGKSYAERYIAKYGSMQYWTTFCCYEPLMLLGLAIEKANSFDTEKVIDAMGEVTFDGTTCPMSFENNRFTGGLPRSIKVKMFVIQIQNGQEVDVYSGYSSFVWGE